MNYFQSIEELKSANLGNVCVTIGNFDGIHLGHQKILKALKELAQDYQDCQTLLITFNPTPLEFFGHSIARIFTDSQKNHLLESHQLVDNILVINFNQDFANTLPVDFIMQICKSVTVKAFLIGDDFKFGKGRSGDYNTFVQHAQELNYDIKNVNTVTHEQQRISSTIIRNYLANGDFDKANQLLLENFAFEGKVVHGKKLARTLDCPTANIAINRHKSPIHGTYFCNVQIEGHDIDYKGICNIGLKPTIDEHNKNWLCEVHILNFNQDIYGKEVKVIPIAKHRDEIKFNSIDELKTQVNKDIDLAYQYFNLTKQI